jgi:hypothetical protein
MRLARPHPASLVLACCLSLGPAACRPTFQSIRQRAMIRSGEVIVLTENGRDQVLVAPGLMGRVLTSSLGELPSLGFVSERDLDLGERGAPFNNFGGQDRLWIGPEAGPNGFFFRPGDPQTRAAWRVPAALNQGAMEALSDSRRRLSVVLTRDLDLTNARGQPFALRLRREIGIIPLEKLNEELGLPLPAGLRCVGSYSLNALGNRGAAKWTRDLGLPCVWILGQFNAGPRVTVIAPFQPGAIEDLGPTFDDDYLGPVLVESPDRLKVLGNAVLFRADARRQGKFGLGPRRSTGFAGAYDPDHELLIVVKFDVQPRDALYPNFSWKADPADPFAGDVFQAYNSGGGALGDGDAEYPFFELASVSPAKELLPGDELAHRHATFFFTGEESSLNRVALRVLETDLAAVRRAMP